MYLGKMASAIVGLLLTAAGHKGNKKWSLKIDNAALQIHVYGNKLYV